MKQITIIFALIMLVSCSKADDAGDIITNEFELINTIFPQDTWKVSYLYTNNGDETMDFATFIFNFKEDGTVDAQTDLFTETGTWSYVSLPHNPETLILQFKGANAFDKISNEWEIVSLSNSKIELSDVGIGNEDTKLLSFSKI